MHCPHCHHEVINDQDIKQHIREELMHLDPDVANSMITQLATRLGMSVRAQGSQASWRHYEVKAKQLPENSEVVQDEY
jgi:hypothetical protein